MKKIEEGVYQIFPLVLLLAMFCGMIYMVKLLGTIYHY